MNSWPHPPLSLSHLGIKVKHIITSTMLCCGHKKESRDISRQQILGEGSAFSTVAHHHHHQALSTPHLGPPTVHMPGTYQSLPIRRPEMVVQGDFRKVSGISSEIFRQIQALEKDFDPTTAAHFEAVEKRGEMIIRLLDPKTLGPAGIETSRKYLSSVDGGTVQFVEIIKRPGQTLGLYIREGNSYRCADGVFISRIALGSVVYNSGLLKVGDEILAVNLVCVRQMSLDDVVIIMSIPRRLVLTIRSRTGRYDMSTSPVMGARNRLEESRMPPVVVVKKEVDDDTYNDEVNSNRDSENGHLLQARLKGLPGDIPAVAVSLNSREQNRFVPSRSAFLVDNSLYYNSLYNSQPHLRAQFRNPTSQLPPMPTPVKDDFWSPYQKADFNRRAATFGATGTTSKLQPGLPPRQHTRTLESVAQELYQMYFGNSPDEPPYANTGGRRGGSLQMTRAAVHQSPLSRTRLGHWDEYLSANQVGALRKNARLLRTRSEHRIPSSEYVDQYLRRLRGGTRTPTPTFYSSLANMHEGRHRRLDDIRRESLLPLRMRRRTDGSVSDTEASDYRMPSTLSDDFLDRYTRRLARSGLRAATPTLSSGLTSMQDIRQRRLDEIRSVGSHRMLRSMRRRTNDGTVSDTELNDYRMPSTLSDDFLNRYAKHLNYGGIRTPTPTFYSGLASMQNARRKKDANRSSSASRALAREVRKTSLLEGGSVSDPEVSSSPKPPQYLTKHKNLRRVRHKAGAVKSLRDIETLRSNSLPRSIPLVDYPHLIRTTQEKKSSRPQVRFEELGDEDSDGVLSAPEFTAQKNRRKTK